MDNKPTIVMTGPGISLQGISPLMSADELAEFLNITTSQLANFRHQYGLHRVKGTNKYSTIQAMQILTDTKPAESKIHANSAIEALKLHGIVRR